MTKDLSFNFKRVHFDVIDSTNSWVKKHLHLVQKSEGLLVTAAGQTAGRGRAKRVWISPPHQNIYATFSFWTEAKRGDVGQIPQLLALAAVDALACFGCHLQIKWPNDLLFNRKKVGGILCETVTEGDEKAIILGIGLNVNMKREELAPIGQNASSLSLESGLLFDLEEILKAIQAQFSLSLSLFLEKSFAPFFCSFEQKLIHRRGDKVQFHDNQTLVEGFFEKMDGCGAVLLRLSDGSHRLFYAGEFLDEI